MKSMQCVIKDTIVKQDNPKYGYITEVEDLVQMSAKYLAYPSINSELWIRINNFYLYI